MGLFHRRYYSDDFGLDRGSWRPPPYCQIQTRIGSMLREQYELPTDLPHELLTLLIELNNQEDND
jgi:hypothetical protein